MTYNIDEYWQDENKVLAYTIYGALSRLEIVRCGECYIEVNELGHLKCPKCFCEFTDEGAKQAFVACFQAINPPSKSRDAWGDEWARIKKIRRFRRNGQLDQLKRIHYVYKDLDGKVVDSRYFYELR